MFDLISERNSFRADIARLGAERDAQRDRADSKQRGWDEANRQLDAMAAERDSLKAKLVEAEANEIKLNAAFTNTCRDLFAKRDAAVQRAEAAEQTLALVEVSENTQAADTERRVVEEIADYVCGGRFTNRHEMVAGILAGAYRKQQESKTTQGARDV